MSLKQSAPSPAISRSLKEDLSDCWHRDRDRSCLRIELNSGEAFIFPYQQFVGAHHLRCSDPETLKISFSTHVVTLSGRGLSEITLALQDMAIAWIKPVESRYRLGAEGKGALVTGIEVKLSNNEQLTA
jgi:hypothetical protein